MSVEHLNAKILECLNMYCVQLRSIFEILIKIPRRGSSFFFNCPFENFWHYTMKELEEKWCVMPDPFF